MSGEWLIDLFTSKISLFVLFLLTILQAVLKTAIGSGIVGLTIFGWRKLFRKKVRTLSKDVIAHRIKIRNELSEQFSKLPRGKDGVEVLLTDVLRGGRTYGENRKFIRKYNYQKAYITDYYDKAAQIIASPLMDMVKYDDKKREWVECESGDKGAKKAYQMGELDYDHVVAIDWVASKTDNVPTLFYNYKLLQPYERTYYAIRKQVDKRFRHHYDELVGPSDADDN